MPKRSNRHPRAAKRRGHSSPRGRAAKSRGGASPRARRRADAAGGSPRARPRATPRSSRAAAKSTRLSVERVNELGEALDIMLPELAARIAALEHLLVDKQICGREDLKRARAFIEMRRASE